MNRPAPTQPAPAQGPAIDARKVSLRFGETRALHEVDLTVAAGEVVALMGPSGSGKSSLLHCLAGILVPDSGSIVTAGLALTESTDAARSRHRLSRMGFVFQFGDLIPELTLLENVALPLELTGTPQREAEDAARECLVRVGVGNLADRRAGEVSGGQLQRASVARAVVHQPEVVFADEPTGSLDSVSGEEVLDLLVGSAVERGAAVVLITHDHRVAAHADRLAVLRDGEIQVPVGSTR